MSLFSKLFGHAGQSLTVVSPAPGAQTPNQTTSWQGIPVKAQVDYHFNMVGSGSVYAGSDNMDYKSYNRYKDHDHVQCFKGGIVLADRVHEPEKSPLDALHLGKPQQLLPAFKALVKGKSIYDVRASGIGHIDYMSHSLELCVLDLAALREAVDQRRDRELFNQIQSREERDLFTFRQTSAQVLLTDQSRDNRPLMIVSSSGLKGGAKDFRVLHRYSSFNQLMQELTNKSEIYNQLFQSSDVFCVGVNKDLTALQTLPAEMIHQIKREIVLGKLESGLKDRLLGVERALVDEIRRNVIKLTFHGGANQSSDTAKSLYLWLSIRGESITGSIVEGKFNGRALSSMKPQELNEFYSECQVDEDSKALCEAYLRHIDFEGFRQKKEWARPGDINESMTLEEACAILGLAVPEKNGVIASADIKSAFRKAANESGHDKGATHKSQAEIDASKARMQQIVDARKVLENRFGG